MFGAKVTPEIIPTAFLFFAVLLIIGGITYRFAKETKGKSLESI
jgi:putative MFS transporter